MNYLIDPHDGLGGGGWYGRDYYPHFTDLEKLIRLRETEGLTQGESTDM